LASPFLLRDQGCAHSRRQSARSQDGPAGPVSPEAGQEEQEGERRPAGESRHQEEERPVAGTKSQGTLRVLFCTSFLRLARGTSDADSDCDGQNNNNNNNNNQGQGKKKKRTSGGGAAAGGAVTLNQRFSALKSGRN
jgi:hypothetical protein